MSTRRRFLKAGVGAVAGAAGLVSIRKPVWGQGPPPFPVPHTPPLTPFVDPLPIPDVHHKVGMERLVPHGFTGDPVLAAKYEVPMLETFQKVHRDLPATRVWGYSGTYPGPTFEVRRGEPILVRYLNLLPEHHFLPIDPTLHGVVGNPEVRTVVHLHGAKVLPDSDGYPEAWFTRNFAQTGPYYTTDTYFYPNDQPATMLWYHDHAIGITRLNVIAGLAGVYLIRDEEEDALQLPDRNKYEIPLVIQDKGFRADGSIDYPAVGLAAGFPGAPPVWNPDFFGDVALVNGKVTPFLEVEPRRYRFRMLNASNSRSFRLHLDAAGPAPFVQIGADQGFLPAPVRLSELTLTPAERADVIIDFAGMDGRKIVMINTGESPFAGLPVSAYPPEIAPPVFPVPLPVPALVMEFRVRRKSYNPDKSTPPENLRLPARTPLSASGAPVRDILMTELTAPFGAPLIMKLEDKLWPEPVSTMPKAGSTEIWRFINGVLLEHPMHVHLANMQVLDRQFFHVYAFMGGAGVIPLGPPMPPEANEINAPKDTINVPHSTITRALVKFELPLNTLSSPGKAFRYVHHCHNLEHEDNEMMRPYDVIG